MNIDEIAARLNFEWTAEEGFLRGLRYGNFEPGSALRFLNVLRAIDATDPQRFDPRIAGSIWIIPFYMLSHISNSESLGADTIERRNVMWQAIDILGRIFGGTPHVTE